MSIDSNDTRDESYIEENEDSLRNKYLTFLLGEEHFGLDISYVIEIVGIQSITKVPDMPSFVRGVINLRGRVIPVMDIRSRLNMPSRDFDDRTCIIVIDVEDRAVGLIVDTVSEVADIEDEHISPPPQATVHSDNRYLQGIGKLGDEITILIAAEKLLGADELKHLDSVS